MSYRFLLMTDELQNGTELMKSIKTNNMANEYIEICYHFLNKHLKFIKIEYIKIFFCKITLYNDRLFNFERKEQITDIAGILRSFNNPLNFKSSKLFWNNSNSL